MNKPAIIIKKFPDLTLEELYLILNARQEVFAIEQRILYQDLDFIDQKSIHILTRDENEKLISYLRIISPEVKYKFPSIGRVLTMKEFRGKGFGRKIMEIGIKEAKQNFKLPIQIEAQEYLLKFYESLGFKAISEPFILEGISHIEMVLE